MSTGQGDDQAAAAAALAALPPLDKMSLVAIWTETVLYGINIVLYAGASYVLLNKPRRQRVHFWLLGASTSLFLISTAHVAVSLRQLVEAFTNRTITSIPGGPSLYFLNQTDQLVFAGQLLYLLNVLIQDLVLIWRLYAVLGGDWKAPILPLVLEAVNQTTAMYTIVKFFHGTPLEDPEVRRFGILSWSLHLIINIGVTCAIAGKIWWQGRKTITIRGQNAYLGVVFTILESGGIFSGATLILFALYINASTGLDALVGVSPIAQLATLSPLLMITRVGFGLTHGTSTAATNTGSTQLSTARFGGTSDALRIDINRSNMSDDIDPEGYAMETMKSDR